LSLSRTIEVMEGVDASNFLVRAVRMISARAVARLVLSAAAPLVATALKAEMVDSYAGGSATGTPRLLVAPGGVVPWAKHWADETNRPATLTANLRDHRIFISMDT
jgi:hypothetical protein